MNAPSVKPLSSLSLAALWFGAAVSMAEILTGGYLTPLGWAGGLTANFLGHLAGAVVFFAAGWIASRTNRSAMGTVTPAFGLNGTRLFSLLNLLQLIGWTAVMVITGAQSLNALFVGLWHWDNPLAARLILGGLLVAWSVLGFHGIRWFNSLVVVLLLVLTVVLAASLVQGHGWPTLAPVAPTLGFGFGDGFELALLMPLSWLPLIGDYTRRARSSLRGNLASSLGYLAGSVWMYLIGLAASLLLGTADPTQHLLQAGLGIAGLLIVILSTTTTGFLDVCSAGFSLQVLLPQVGEKSSAGLVGLVGVALSLVFPMDQYQDFLFALGSVFAPLFAVILTHHWLHRSTAPHRWAVVVAFVAWGLGVAAYYLLKPFGTPVGLSLPVLGLTSLLYFSLIKGVKLWKN